MFQLLDQCCFFTYKTDKEKKALDYATGGTKLRIQ